jgi:hypothetical protein
LEPNSHAVSADGKLVATVASEGVALVSSDGGQPQLVSGTTSGERPLRWAQAPSTLFVGTRGETSCPVARVNVQTGARTAWKTFSPADVAGVVGVACPRLAADEQHYVFGYVRNLSDLFLVEHLK